MILWLVETFVTLNLLLLLVLAMRRPVARLFGAGWAYALWAVPAARLLLPPLPSLSPEIQLPAVASYIPAATGGTAPLPVEAGLGQWVPLMLAMWAGGAVIFLTMQWLAYRAFLREVEAGAAPARPSRHGGIAILLSEAVDGPVAMGLLRRRIVIPADFALRYSREEQRLALEHELTHHRRRDIWWNMAAVTVLASNWFNPIAWAAFRAFRADQELACDAAVASRASSEERWDYARALVKSASRPGLIAACPLNGANQLKRRLRMMRAHRISAGRRAGGLALLGAFALVAFGLATAEVGEAAREAPRLASLVSAARAEAPAPAPVTLAVASAAKRSRLKSRTTGAAGRAVTRREPASDPFRSELITVPDDAIEVAKLAPMVRAPRGVRVEETVRPAPGERTHFIMVRRTPAAGPGAEALAHALARPRAGHGHGPALMVRMAEARPAVEQFEIRFRTDRQGDDTQ